MRTVELIANVTEEGTLTVRVPAGIMPGPHRVVLQIEESPARSPLTFSSHVLGDEATSCFRREDIYDEAGR